MKECQAQGVWQFACRTKEQECAYEQQIDNELKLRDKLTLQELDIMADTTIRLTGCLKYWENLDRILEEYDKILRI